MRNAFGDSFDFVHDLLVGVDLDGDGVGVVVVVGTADVVKPNIDLTAMRHHEGQWLSSLLAFLINQLYLLSQLLLKEHRVSLLGFLQEDHQHGHNERTPQYNRWYFQTCDIR